MPRWLLLHKWCTSTGEFKGVKESFRELNPQILKMYFSVERERTEGAMILHMNVSYVNLVFIVRMRSCLSRWFARQVTIVTLAPYNLWVAIAGLFALKVWDQRIRIMRSTNRTSYKLENLGQLGSCPWIPAEGFWLEFKCKPGTFNDQSHQPACFSCPAGYYCPSEGTIDPLKCPDKQVSGIGQSLCTKCPAGHLCRNGIDIGYCETGGYCVDGDYR